MATRQSCSLLMLGGGCACRCRLLVVSVAVNQASLHLALFLVLTCFMALQQHCQPRLYSALASGCVLLQVLCLC